MKTYAWEDHRRFNFVEGPQLALDSARGATHDTRFPEPGPKRPTRVTPHTYVIGSAGSSVVKIGHSINPMKRLASLQTGHHQELVLLWSTEGDYESALHRRFDNWLVRGEWFDLSSLGEPAEVVAAAVEQIRSQGVSGAPVSARVSE